MLWQFLGAGSSAPRPPGSAFSIAKILTPCVTRSYYNGGSFEIHPTIVRRGNNRTRDATESAESVAQFRKQASSAIAEFRANNSLLPGSGSRKASSLCYRLLPLAMSVTTPITCSTSASVIAGYIGRDKQRSNCASAVGKSPY